VFGSQVLSNWFPEHFGCGWSWPSCWLDMYPCNYFHTGATSKTVYTTPTHTLFKSCKCKLKLFLKRSQVTCCMTLLTTLWFIYSWVRKVKGSHTDHVLTWRPQAHELPMKVNSQSHIICFGILENYKYIVPWNWCMFLLISCRCCTYQMYQDTERKYDWMRGEFLTRILIKTMI